MRKIPRNCKVANVLVGECNSLSEEIVILIRLQNPFVVGQFSEVAINTKYLFILLGPKGNMVKYLEIGKCMCTLFADEVGNLFQQTNDLIGNVLLLSLNNTKKKLFQHDMFDAESKIDVVRGKFVSFIKDLRFVPY